MRVRLLGGFDVEVDGRPIPASAWRLRKASELVRILCVAPGHRLPREQLIEQLWPDRPPDSALNNLHQAPALLTLTDISWGQAKRPRTLDELVSYTGADRQQVILDGAKAEGKLIWYTSLSGNYKEIVEAFKKKYPQVEQLDARGKLVMPGNLVAHTHFYGAFARGMSLPPGPPPRNFPEILHRLRDPVRHRWVAVRNGLRIEA